MKVTKRKLIAKVVTFPFFQSVKYRKYIISTIDKTKKDINKVLVSFFTIHKDDYVDDLKGLFDDIRTSLTLSDELVIANLIQIGTSIVGFTRRQLINSLRGIISINDISNNLGVDVFSSPINLSQNELLKSWVSTNTRLITSINETLLNDVATIIESGFRAGNTTSYIQGEIKDRFGVSDKKASLVARDQTAKLHSNYIRQEHLDLGITEYVWLTSNDERVRTSHKVLNNKIMTWEDASIYKDQSAQNWEDKSGIGGVELQVGEDFQCRCAIKAIVSI